MNITNIDLISSSLTDLINLSFRDPTSQNSYITKAIVGLDADEISSKFYGVGNVTNNKYYSMSVAKRTLVISILLNPKYELGETPSTLRDALYKGIASSRTGAITLKFKDGASTVAIIKGFLVKLEATHFANSPEIQLTIDCVDPMFTSEDFVNVDVGSLTPEAPNIVDSLSTAPHGFLFSVSFNDTTTYGFSIADAEQEDWAFTVNYDFQGGDILSFSSINNERHLYVDRINEQRIHIVDKIASNSIWPVLFPGENPFVITATNFNLDAVSYKTTYWGI
jgi:hypothetical protein